MISKQVVHCFTIGGLNVKTASNLDSGETETLTFKPTQQGIFTYACLIASADGWKNHRSMSAGHFARLRFRGNRLIIIISPQTCSIKEEVLQLCRQPVIGWPDAPPGLFGLRFIQVAAI
jgi:hypothetical protein